MASDETSTRLTKPSMQTRTEGQKKVHEFRGISVGEFLSLLEQNGKLGDGAKLKIRTKDGKETSYDFLDRGKE